MAGFAQDYLIISALALPAMLLILAATGALRGVLDLRTPLIATIVANILNVVLNLTFVYGFDWGVRGAAAGTAVAQWLAAGWLVTVVVQASPPSQGGDPPAYDRDRRTRLASASRCWSGRSRCAPRSCWRPSSRPSSATFRSRPTRWRRRVVTFLAFGLDAIAIAGQTLTGRTLGAGDAAGTRALTNRMIGWGVATGVVAAVLLAGSAPWLPRLFSSDPAVQDALVPALLVVAAIQPLSGVVFVLDGVLIGAGDGAYLAWAGLAGPRGVRPAGAARRVDGRRLHVAVDRLRRVHRGTTRDALATTAGHRVDGARHHAFGTLRS